MSRVEVRPGQELQIKLTPDNLPVRRAWPPVLAYGTGVLAVVAFASGAFLGELSSLQPSGDTRQAAMDDLDQKRRFALTANVAFGTGAALALTSLFTFIRYRDDIFGRPERYEE